MTDNDRSPDQIIHEAMGLCWHNFTDAFDAFWKGVGWEECPDCKRPIYPEYGPNEYRTDYAKDLRPVFEWMTETRGDTTGWYLLESFYFDQSEETLATLMDAGPEAIRDTVAQWIESTRE